jgi:hypothetical protein
VCIIDFFFKKGHLKIGNQNLMLKGFLLLLDLCCWINQMVEDHAAEAVAANLDAEDQNSSRLSSTKTKKG